jgi:hypothetical protein
MRDPIAFLICSACLLFAGCTVTDRDVSNDPHFAVGYRPGAIYRLVQPVNVLELRGGYDLKLIPVGDVRAYGKPAGSLPAGTRIKILDLEHIVRAAPIQWETLVATHAEIVGGPDKNVDLNDISGVRWVDGDHGMETSVAVPDPKWLVLDDHAP